MPTYDYKCPKCGAMQDHFHSMTKEPVFSCTKCGTEMERQIGTGGPILFKGSGFHSTDYPKLP